MESQQEKENQKGTAFVAIGLLLLTLSITAFKDNHTLKYIGLISSVILFLFSIYLNIKRIRSKK